MLHLLQAGHRGGWGGCGGGGWQKEAPVRAEQSQYVRQLKDDKRKEGVHQEERTA